MKCMLVVSCLVALAAANPGYLANPAVAGLVGHAYAAAPVAYSALVAPGAVTSQYHTQDSLGQYAYGYQGDTSAKQEVRTADGITQGAYSYLDAHGLVQSASYVSDPLNGFRVAATNIPVGPDAAVVAAAAPVAVAAPAVAPVAVAAPAVAPVAVADTVEVTAARAAHYNAHVLAKAGLLGRKKRSPGYLGAPLAVAHAAAPVAVAHAVAPVAVAHAAPVAIAAPVSSFGYSSVSVHPPTVVGAVAHAAPVAVAPVAVAHAAPLAYADAAHIAAKAALLGRKKRSPGYLAAPAIAAPLAYAAPVAHYASPIAHVAAPISTTTYHHAPLYAY